MATEVDIMAAAKAVTKGLESSQGRFVRLGGEERPILLALRGLGEEIDDPECDQLFETLRGGVFKRFESERDGVRSFRWMHLGPCTPEFLAEALRADFEDMDERDLRAVPIEIAFNSVMAEGRGQRM